MSDATSTAVADAAPTTPREPGWKKWVRRLCLLLAGILLVVGGVSVWARNFVLDTDKYVSTMAPLAENPDIQQAASVRIGNAVGEQIDVAALLNEYVGPKAALLAAPIQSAIESAAKDLALRVVQSTQFQTLWDDANRVSHQQVVNLLTGEGATELQGDYVVLDLRTLVTEVQTRLVDRGFTVAEKIPVDKIDATVPLFKATNLDKAQSLVDRLQRWAVLFPLLAILLFAAAIWLSPHRRRTVIHIGIIVMVGALFVVTAVAIGKRVYLNEVDAFVLSKSAAAAVYDIVIRNLRYGARVLFVIGALMALIAWLFGPGGSAGSVRRFLAAHRQGADIAVAVAVGLWLLVVESLTWSSLFWAIVAIAALIGLIHLLAARASAEPVTEEPALNP